MKHTECIITGCNFVDVTGWRWCHGDLFICGDAYIFNACMTHDPGPMNVAWQYSTRPESGNAISCTNGSYFEKRGVIVFDRESAEMNDLALRYVKPEHRPATGDKRK